MQELQTTYLQMARHLACGTANAAVSLWVTTRENFMSIRKMISLHPSAREHVNQPLGDAVHHLMYCSKMCLSCADACLAEPHDLTQCVRLCLDCSDICEATARLGLR